MGGLLLSEIINRSVIAWYCVTVIYLARLFLKKISRKYCYFLWLVVFLNLCIPFSVVSSFSLIPQKLMELSVEEKVQKQPKPEMTEDIIAGDEGENMIVFEGGTSYEEEMKELFPEAEVPGKQEAERDIIGLLTKEFWLIWGERVWILGIFLLGCYSLWETLRFNQSLKKEKSTVAEGEEHIIIVPNLSSPVLWGFFSPIVYLPQDLEEGEKTYIIAHENYHRKRKDYLVKPIIYMITIVYWFHPLVWLAYHLCCEDMEMSCDEAVLEKTGSNIRKEYAHSLLKYAAKQNGFLLHPLTFGEPSLRSRIESILKYKKKNVYVTVVALAVAMAVGAGLLLRPIEEISGTIEEDREENQSQVWTPEDIVEEKRDEELGYLWNPTPGQPCENPVETGWNMEHIVDVRENFSQMPYVPEKGTEEDTYLLGKTKSYTLYGKGDYKYLLLECDGKYAQVRYDYTSNYMTPLELMETDIDRDGKTELAIKFNVMHGTGVSVDTFLLADFGTDSKLYVHQYLDEDFNIDLGAALSYEKNEYGLQAKVNGENAGYFMENMEDMGAFNIATVGCQMHFYYDQIENEIQLSGDIMFMAEDSVSYWINWNDVTATVCWNGEEFSLSDFTSRNRDMEERIIEALEEDYGVESLYDVDLYYDASEMNQETISVTAEILKTKSDRVYDRKEINLKRGDEEVYGGWEVEGILSKSPRMQKTMISFMVEGLKEEVSVVLYNGNDYSIYIPEEGWQMTETDIWESVHNEKVKLQIMDYEGESVEEFREQLLEDGYSLDGYGSVKLTKYDSEEALIQNVRIQKFNDRIKGIFYSYPLEAEEGFGTRLERIVSTFEWENK